MLDQILANLYDESRCQGLTDAERDAVAAVMAEFADVFGCTLRRTPIQTSVRVFAELTRDGTCFRANYRVTDPAKVKYARAHTAEKLALGIIEAAPGNLYAAAAFYTPKTPGADGLPRYREVANYQPMDRVTKSIGTEPLEIAAILAGLHGHRYKCVLDLFSAFFQVQVDRDSRPLFGYITVDGVFTPSRLVMGWKNSPAWLRLVLEEVFHGLGLAIYVDDILVSARTFAEFLAKLRAVLLRCRERNVILGACKYPCSVVVPFLGLTVTEAGWRKTPTSMGPLRERAPVTVGDLVARIGYLGWLRDNCPRLDLHLAPLNDVVTRAHALMGKSTKASDDKVPLDWRVGWTAEHERILARAWEAVDKSVELAFPSPDRVINIISDASDVGCGYVITQVSPEDMALPVGERRHELLALYAHRFVGSALNWTVGERELEPLHRALTRERHLVMGRPVHAYVDHLNLIGLLHHPELLHRRTSSTRVIRRILDFGGLDLTVHHVPGVLNGFADLLSRQFVYYPLPVIPQAAVRSVTAHFVGPGDGSGFAMPSQGLLRQHSVTSEAGAEATAYGAVLGADGLYRVGDRIWVPSGVRSAVIAAVHCGRGGHRSAASAVVHLAGFTWGGRDAQVAAEIKACIHCARARPGTVPRPFGSSFVGSAVGEVLTADYFSVPADKDGLDHFLLATDTTSQFTWAFPTGTPDGPTTVRLFEGVLLEHNLQPKVVSCDGGPGFTGSFVTFLERRQVRHHPHVPRAPWTNGAAERRGKEVLRALRQQLSEQRRPTTGWVGVLRLAVFAVNNTPSVQLGGRTPFAVFTGRPSPSLGALAAAFDEEFPGLTQGEIEVLADAARVEFLVAERDVLVHRSEALERRQRLRAAEPRVEPVDFVQDDYVLVAVPGGLVGDQDKLSALWEGPFVVTESPVDQVAEVRRVGSTLRQRVHVQRLAFFDGPEMDVTEELQQVADLTAPGTYLVDEIVDLVNLGRDKFRFIVTWVGYSDRSEELVTKLYHQVPEVVEDYLGRDDLPTRVRALVPRVWAAIDRSQAAHASTLERRQVRVERQRR